jgi:hypothetical protein
VCRELSAHAVCANQRAVTEVDDIHDIAVSRRNIGGDEQSPRNVHATKGERTIDGVTTIRASAKESSVSTLSPDVSFLRRRA